MADPAALFAQGLQGGMQAGLSIAQLNQRKEEFGQQMQFQQQQADVLNDIRRQQMSLEQSRAAAQIGLVEVQTKQAQAQTDLTNWNIERAKELPMIQASMQQAISQTWQENKDPSNFNIELQNNLNKVQGIGQIPAIQLEQIKAQENLKMNQTQSAIAMANRNNENLKIFNSAMESGLNPDDFRIAETGQYDFSGMAQAANETKMQRELNLMEAKYAAEGEMWKNRIGASMAGRTELQAMKGAQSQARELIAVYNKNILAAQKSYSDIAKVDPKNPRLAELKNTIDQYTKKRDAVISQNGGSAEAQEPEMEDNAPNASTENSVNNWLKSMLPAPTAK